jgi:hypothetical protein
MLTGKRKLTLLKIRSFSKMCITLTHNCKVMCVRPSESLYLVSLFSGKYAWWKCHEASMICFPR